MKKILSTTLLLLLLSLPVYADYLAYAIVDNQALALPKNLALVDSKHLLNVKWGKFNGNKTRLGVLPVKNNSTASVMKGSFNGRSYSIPTGGGSGVPVQGIESIITTVLNNTKRFTLLERNVLDQALKEQDLGNRASKQSVAKKGKILGAKYLLQTVVTNYEEGVESNNAGAALGALMPGFGLLGAIGTTSSKGVIGMNFRIINSETTEVIYSTQIEVAMVESGLTFGGLGVGAINLGGFSSSYSKTPIGQAVISAINKGVYEVIKQIKEDALQGVIIKVANDKIYINLGADFVSNGDRFKVVTKGEEFIDPDTGLSLGDEDEYVTDAQITSVKKKYSIAKLDKVVPNLKRKDKVISYKKPINLSFAHNWQLPKEQKTGLLDALGVDSSDSDELVDEVDPY